MTSDSDSGMDEYWWYGEKCSADDFSDRLAGMLISEVSVLISETSVVISHFNRFANDASHGEAERAEARQNAALVSKKRGIARKAATRIHAQLEAENKGRLNRLDDLLIEVDLLADENPSAAMHTLVAALRSYWKIDEQLDKIDQAEAEVESKLPEHIPQTSSHAPRRRRPPINPEVLIARRR